MKIIGLFLIVVGIACFAFLISGLFAWTTPVPDPATPGSLADTLATKMILLFVSGTVCIIGGAVAFIRGIVKSRGANLAKVD